MLKDNPKYQIAFRSEVHNCDFYVPASDNDYHLSRYVAAQAQNIYSSCGTTKDLLRSFLDKMIELCNDADIKTVRTDVAILANNLKYRLQYPVDEDCALRMGALYVMHEDESDDGMVRDYWTAKKVEMCKGSTHNIATSAGNGVDIHGIKADPLLYDFFLTEGIKLTQSWTESESPSTDMDYFKNRNDMLATLLPQ